MSQEPPQNAHLRTQQHGSTGSIKVGRTSKVVSIDPNAKGSFSTTSSDPEAARKKQLPAATTRPSALGISVRAYAGDAFDGFEAADAPIRLVPGTKRLEGTQTKPASVLPNLGKITTRSVLAPLPLPALRRRRGCVGASNRATCLANAYEDRMRAFGLTKAGTAGMDPGERINAFPGEHGPVEVWNKAEGRKVKPDEVDGRHRPERPGFPHSMGQVLSLSPGSWDNTRPPAPYAPTYLLASMTPDRDRTVSRFGSNTEWKHSSFVTVQAPPESHYFMPEKERLKKVAYADFEQGRKRGVAAVPGRRLEVEPTY
ncbi:hypothetical protein HKX48_009314 [Thoreauomyces humboldtii]|nr:hypothetical protein HKX48_009314 [Thoreauomyces humboldtii]